MPSTDRDVRIRTRVIVTLMAVLSTLAAGCASDASSVDNTVEGIVTEVTGDLSTVESFVIMDSEGKSHFFKPEPGLLFYGGPLPHLRDHVVSGQRVVVTYEVGAYGERTAVLITHADPSADHEHDG